MTKWKHEEKSCRDTLARVHDSYSSVVEIDSSSISTIVAAGKKRVVTVTFLMETEKRQRGNSFATIGKGGGGKGPLCGDRDCLFKTAASCLYDPWVRN